MKLVLAEKPSVAQSLAQVLGANKHCNGYFEGYGYLVSWCVGHLVELSQPEAYNEAYAKWQLADLPILPNQWQYQVSASTRKQFDILKSLMMHDDITEVINACDAGREGELIFRLVYNQCRCSKPVERLWVSSMEDSAIREGFANLKPGSEYDALYEAALCRERADWIVGINATRLFSCLYGKTLNVGRVMTPTLAMVAMRDAKVAAFKSEPFYSVQLTGSDLVVTGKRYQEKEKAESQGEFCKLAKRLYVRYVNRKERCERPPLPYDLTTLQRDANRILGFTAKQTLDYAQSLYEKKLITYPRTDSNYLTEDMEDSICALIQHEAEVYPGIAGSIHQPQRIINSSKVTDHHAIIPTREVTVSGLKELPSGEKAILQMISVRLACSVADDYRYAETEIKCVCAGEGYTAKGKEILNSGWHGIWSSYYASKTAKESANISNVSEGAVMDITDIQIKEGKTEAPRKYTEDTLLSAMQNAAKEDIPEEAERQGIGTPATRAAIIEKLVQKGFLERDGNRKNQYLKATEKGSALITIMPEQIQSAAMTAEWEQKLLMIERGEYSSEKFMEDIKQMVSDLVRNTRVKEGSDVFMTDRKVIGTCPHCGCEIISRDKGWFCANRKCRFVIWKDNAFFKRLSKHPTEQLVKKLVKEGQIKLKDCMNPEKGRPYDATVFMSLEADGRPKFSLSFEKRGV